MLKAALIVGLGSFFGGSIRFLVATLVDSRWGDRFPWGIFVVNFAGSLAIGFLAHWFRKHNLAGDSYLPLLLSVGFLGGFTTFSTFSLQTLRLIDEGHMNLAFANMGLNLLGCLAAAYAGMRISASVFEV
ncbi:MAG: fluoride efflux transporter CrcB [Verrucomicrobiota bacterium]